MKSGISLIQEERREQINKHGRTIQKDIQININEELRNAASFLLYGEKEVSPMSVFGPIVLKNWDQEMLNKMDRKSYKERLIIAGALIAAEIDRIQN